MSIMRTRPTTLYLYRMELEMVCLMDLIAHLLLVENLDELDPAKSPFPPRGVEASNVGAIDKEGYE